MVPDSGRFLISRFDIPSGPGLEFFTVLRVVVSSCNLNGSSIGLFTGGGMSDSDSYLLLLVSFLNSGV